MPTVPLLLGDYLLASKRRPRADGMLPLSYASPRDLSRVLEVMFLVQHSDQLRCGDGKRTESDQEPGGAGTESLLCIYD